MNPAELQRRLALLAPMARDAAALAARLRDEGKGAARLKGAQDFLTEADGATEDFIRGELARLFPGEGILGEEGGGEVSDSGPLWIIDPI
ncbi:MAG: inositol monophosphatase family protein, partial [Alphaproteobacteria bacterium]